MRIGNLALSTIAILFALGACGPKKKSDDGPKTDPGNGTGTDQPPPGDDDDHDDDHDDGGTHTYTVDDLNSVTDKAVKRFTRLEVPNATVKLVKTWIEPEYVWARLVYVTTAAGGEETETVMLLACHPHGGTELACHKKTTAGTLEPADDQGSEDDLDLPPVDDL